MPQNILEVAEGIIDIHLSLIYSTTKETRQLLFRAITVK